MKVAFLDRDGTIIKDYLDIEWKNVKEPEFLDGSIEGIRKLIEDGYNVIIVTNQYLINDGIISIDQYESFTSKILGALEKEHISILDIYYCPHSKDEKCDCRKPAIGMIKKAMERHPNIDLTNSILVGDSTCDEEFANALAMDFHGIRGGNLNNQNRLFDSINDVAICRRKKEMIRVSS